MAIPLIQYALACTILGVSCAVTCGADNAFDTVLNSLAFTFLSELSSLFNDVVSRYYTATAIAGLDPNEYGTDPINYLVGEYDETQAYDDPKLWHRSWYIRREWKLAGLLTDYTVRHNPADYDRPWHRHIVWLRRFFFLCPLVAPAACFFVFTPTQ